MADIPAADIGYVEAHGTGTALGDPIELAALRAAHRADGPPPERCLKANIGHLDAAAGVTGLIKTALVLREQVVPGQPTLRSVSTRLELAGTGYAVPTATMRPAEPLRAAAVSSFGLGGTNAHAVLTVPPTTDREPVPASPFRVPLSAADAAGLREAVARLRAWCAGRPALRIDDIAFTLQRARRRCASLRRVRRLRPARTAGRAGPLPHVRAAAGRPARGERWPARARRTPLPGTVLRRVRHWVDAPAAPVVTATTVQSDDRPSDPPDEAVAEPEASEVATRITEIVGAHLGSTWPCRTTSSTSGWSR